MPSLIIKISRTKFVNQIYKKNKKIRHTFPRRYNISNNTAKKRRKYMLTKPIIIELTEIKTPSSKVEGILKPKVAKARRLSERQREIINTYKRFQEKLNF